MRAPPLALLIGRGCPQRAQVWSAVRGRGRKIPSGGTLVVGREQDCEGGCFDSAQGAAGSVDVKQEYGAEGAPELEGIVRFEATVPSLSPLSRRHSPGCISLRVR